MLAAVVAADLLIGTSVSRWDEQSHRAAQCRHVGLVLVHDQYQTRLAVGCGSSPATAGTASEIYRALVPADNAFETTLSRVLELYQGDPDEHPEPAAVEKAWDILHEARSQMSEFPRGSACSDLDRGIWLRWLRGDRDVSLIIPASGGRKPYIYQGEGDKYSVLDASPMALASWLNWLGHG